MSDSDWSSDGDDEALVAPTPIAPAAAEPEEPPSTPSPAVAAPNAAPTTPQASEVKPTATAAPKDPSQPVVVLAQSVQLFKYNAAGQAQPQGVAGGSILAWPSTPKRALLVYDAQRRTVCTGTIWGGFQFTLQNGVYGTFTDDQQKCRWSLLFNSPSIAERFAAQVCLAKYHSLQEPRAVSVVEFAAGSGDTPAARKGGLTLKYQVWHYSQDSNDPTPLPETPTAQSTPDADTDADGSDDKDPGTIPMLLPKAPEPLKGFGTTLEGKVVGWRGAITLDCSNDDIGLLPDRTGIMVAVIEVVSVDKKGKETRKLKKGKDRKKKKEEHREKKRQEKEQAEAKVRAEREAKEAEQRKIAEKRAEERKQLEGVMDALRELYTLARGTTDFIKKRGLKDVMSVLSALYSACEERFAADASFTGAEVHGAMKELMRDAQTQAKTVLQEEARDEIAQQFAATLATLKDETEQLVKDFRAQIAKANEEGGPAMQAKLQAAQDENLTMMSTVETLMERIESAEKARDAAVAAGKDKADIGAEELNMLKDQLRQYENVADDFAKRVKEATEEADRYKKRIKQLEREKADLVKVQKGHKLTWVPDNVVAACLKCSTKFGKFKWRHHCRYCGRVFCASCASSKRSIPALGYDSAVRVCDSCSSILATAGIGNAGEVSDDDDDGDDDAVYGGGGSGGGRGALVVDDGSGSYESYSEDEE